jgi:hypothetical protein
MTIALIDDQLLSTVLRGNPPRILASMELHTTGYWYVRLCQAVLGATERTGTLSRPFSELPLELRERAVRALLELPAEIGLVSLRELAPLIGQLRAHHRLNILGMEALAAAKRLGADVHLSAPSPLLEDALRRETLKVRIHRSKR